MDHPKHAYYFDFFRMKKMTNLVILAMKKSLLAITANVCKDLVSQSSRKNPRLL